LGGFRTPAHNPHDRPARGRRPKPFANCGVQGRSLLCPLYVDSGHPLRGNSVIPRRRGELGQIDQKASFLTNAMDTAAA
jgi:hypothetical protein